MSTNTAQFIFIKHGNNTDEAIDYVNSTDTTVTNWATGGPAGTNPGITAPIAIQADLPGGIYYIIDPQFTGDGSADGQIRLGHTATPTAAPTTVYTVPDNSPGSAFSEANAIAIDTTNHILYLAQVVYDSSLTALDLRTGIVAFNYNPTTGALTNAATPNFILTRGAAGSQHTDLNIDEVAQLSLDSTHHVLYFTDDTFGNGIAGETNSVKAYDLVTHVETTVVTFPSAPGSGGYPSGYTSGTIFGVAADPTDNIVFFSTASGFAGSEAQNKIYAVLANGTGQVQLTEAPAFDSLAPFNLTFDDVHNQLYVSYESTGSTPGHLVRYDVNIPTPGSTAGITLTNPVDLNLNLQNPSSGVDYPVAGFINQLPVLTLGSGTATEPVQGGSRTLLTSEPSITDADGDHLASVTVQVTSGVFSGDELFVNGQQAGTLDSGAITVSWDNTNKILKLTGYDTLAEYQILLGEVSFQETGNDTSQIGVHTTRTITWQANDGALGNPSGQNTQTSIITIDRPPVAVADTNTAVSGGAAATGNVVTNDTDRDGDTLTVMGFIDGSGGTVGTLFHGIYGDLTLNADGSYSYSAGATSGEQSALAAAAAGSHPTEVISYTESDGHGGTSSSTLTITLDRLPVAVADTNSAVSGGTAATGNVLTNDTDKDADTLTVTGFTDGGSGTVGTLFQGTYGDLTLNSNGTYSYSAGATASEQTALAAAAAGSHPTEVVTYTESDGHGGTSSSTLTIGVDRAPALSLNVTQETYTVLSAAQALQSAVTITDPDGSDAIAGAKVTLTGGYAGDGDLLSYNGNVGTVTLGDGSQYNVVYSGAGTAETLTITTTSGTGTQADYIQLLDGVVFSSTSADPTNVGANSSRSATFQITDGGGATSATAGPETINLQFAPVISSVTATTVGNLTDLDATKVVTITVNFSNIVNVTGTPQLQLNDLEKASYTGGTGTTALTFSYTVQPGDNTPDLQVQSLLLSGGATIQDGAGHDAVLTNAAADLHLQVDTLAPTVSVAADHTALLAGQTAVVTFTFSESVPGFVLGDTTVSGGALSNLVHVGINGSHQDIYTATFTPGATNTEAGSVQVNASSYTDAAGNTGAASNTVAFTGDTLAPTVSVAADHTALLAGQTATVTFAFSESVPGFVLGDTTVSGGALSNLIHVGINGSHQDIYTATFTPGATNTEAGSVQVNASSYTDAAGNIGAASNTVSFTGDTLAPTVSVAADHTALLAGQTAVVTFTFSESVPGFVLGDTTVSGGALSNLVHVGINGSNQDIYTATFTPGATNTEAGSVQVNASSYTDAAGNTGAASNTVAFTGDTLAPTVSVAADHTALLAGQTATVTFTFSESVPGFVLGDTTVSGGALSNLVHVGINGSNQDIYTATFTPSVTNTEAGSVQVNASSYTDAAGNTGAASNTLSFSGDTLAPTVSVAADHTALLAGQTAVVTFTFSESVPGFVLGDTTVSGGALSNLIHVGINGSHQDIYTATFTPGATNTEAGSVQVNASSYTDLAGNHGAASNTVAFTGDTLAPTVSVAADHTALLAGQTATVTFTFSESVPGFVLGDTTVSGGALSNLIHVGINGSHQDIYTATFTPGATNTEAGSVQVNASSYTDLAGNHGAASNTVAFTGDTLAPTVSVAADHTALLAGQTATVTFTFSESVPGFVLGDTTVSGGALSNLIHVGINGSHQDIYTATFTPGATNTEAGSVQVNASSYTDAAGNTGAASNTVAFTGDTLAPTVSVAADHTALLAGQTAVVTFTFSESVPGFVLGDTTVSGGALSNLVHVGINGSHQDIYTATFTPGATNTEAGSVQVNASSYTDAAGNTGAASNTLSFSGDTLAPTVSVAADHTALLAGQTAVVTFTFSESVPGFVLGDTTVSGGALSNLIHVGINGSHQDIYTATFTPGATNTEAGSVQVNASSYTDAAGNTGAASNTVSFTGDTLAPTVSVAADHTALLAGQTAVVTFTFSESVPGFVLGDTTVSGGALSNLVHVGINGSNQDIYTATFTPAVTNTEAGSVQVNASSYTDAAGNTGAASNTVAFTGDTLAPTISSVTTSGVGITAGNGDLNAGHVVTLTLNTSEVVNVNISGGTPTLVLNDGGVASYVGGSGTSALNFSYRVAPGENTGDLVVNQVLLHGATIQDAIGNNATLPSGAINPAGTLRIDTLAPQITAVTASPSHGIEGIGQSLAITVAFGEAVTLSGGTPTLSLNDHGTATYDAVASAALHDASKLVFDYTVGVSDTITPALAVTGINLHGAIIDDLAGNVANLSNIATVFTGLGVDSSLLTAHPDSNHVLAGQAVTADAAHGVLANDTDSNPADHVTVSAVDGLAAGVNQPVAGAYGSLTLHADGSYSYTASSAVTGAEFDTFTYTASNGHSPASTSTLTIEVTGGNQNYVQVPSGGSATGGFGNTALDGSAGNATLTAAVTFGAGQTLIGGPGDTLNAASYGQDTFVFAGNFGHETINNFQPALDVIQVQQSQFGSLAAVMADIHQVGADSVLMLDANHVITITNTPHTSLTAADFHLV